MERRRFLAGLVAGAGAIPALRGALQTATGRLDALASDLDAASTSGALWRRVRREFALEPGVVHLNCGTLGATPRLVLDAVSAALRETEGNPALRMFRQGVETLETVRGRAASFLGADLDEIAFTRNTTEGMNAVAGGIDLRPGDQVLTTDHEHGGGMVCWQHLRRRRGVEIVYVEMPRAVRSEAEILERIEARLTPRTRVCSFSHVDTIAGVRMPMRQIAELTRSRDVLLVCDGAQAPGMIDVDVHGLGVDAYACSGHKWLLAPKGTGLLYVRREAQERIRPAFLYDGYRGYTASGGTRDVAGLVGLLATLDFHEALGRDRVLARAAALSRHLRERLEGISGLEILTPPGEALSGAIVTVALKRGDSAEVVARMNREHGIVLKNAQATYAYCVEPELVRRSYNAVRFSTHVFNDENEIERTVETLRGVLPAV